jgi:hypothetical protein
LLSGTVASRATPPTATAAPTPAITQPRWLRRLPSSKSGLLASHIVLVVAAASLSLASLAWLAPLYARMPPTVAVTSPPASAPYPSSRWTPSPDGAAGAGCCRSGSARVGTPPAAAGAGSDPGDCAVNFSSTSSTSCWDLPATSTSRMYVVYPPRIACTACVPAVRRTGPGSGVLPISRASMRISAPAGTVRTVTAPTRASCLSSSASTSRRRSAGIAVPSRR